MSLLSFQYKAIGSRGTPVKGVIQASNQEEAYRKIVAAGMKPLRITGKRAGGGRQKRVTLKDIAHFTAQFAVLMEARLPIVDGLRSIVEQETNERFRRVIEDVARQIEAGNSVTDALSPHRELFGEVYVETIRAAEASGNIIAVLTQLSAMLERQYEIQKTIKGAMLYPLCVIAALILAVVFLLIFVIPRFAEMFASRGLDLPLPTQFVIACSDVIRMYWYIILALSVGGIFTLRRAWKTPSSRKKIDTWLHVVPFLRDMLRGAAISRFTNVLGISLRSGLSLIDALEMGGRASGRPLLQIEADKLRDQVNIGGRLSDVIVTCEYFPPFTRRMLAAGEEAAELPKMCEMVSRSYDRDIEHMAKNVTTVMEPIMIVGLAGIVLLIALAIFLPMWNMAAVIG